MDKKEKMKIGCMLGVGHRKVYKRRGPPKGFRYDDKMVDFYMKHYIRGALREVGHRKVYKRRGPPKGYRYDDKMVDFYMMHYIRGALRGKRLVQLALG